MNKDVIQKISRRACYRCEYCLMPKAYYPTEPFPIDHIIARQHAGTEDLSNLALSCLHCNSHKGPNIAGRDPKTMKLTPLFHPRKHRWSVHFRWKGGLIIGRTPIGRTTVQVLNLNSPEFVVARLEILEEGWRPE